MNYVFIFLLLVLVFKNYRDNRLLLSVIERHDYHIDRQRRVIRHMSYSVLPVVKKKANRSKVARARFMNRIYEAAQ